MVSPWSIEALSNRNTFGNSFQVISVMVDLFGSRSYLFVIALGHPKESVLNNKNHLGRPPPQALQVCPETE